MGYVLRRTRLLQRVATLPWNERQVGYGISGKFGVESVATLPWNRWQLSRGIRTQTLILCFDMTFEQRLST